MEPNQSSSLFEMQADGLAQSRLNSISKWSKFIAIVVLIMVIITAIFLFVAKDQIIEAFSSMVALDNRATGVLIGIIVVVMGLVIIWLVALFRAATFIKQGLLSKNSDRLAEGFKAMRIFFAISVVFSVLSILGTLTSMF